MRHLHVFHSGFTSFNSHQQRTSFPFYPHPCRHLRALLTGVRWHLTRSLIYIFLMTVDVEHRFICLLVIFLIKMSIYILCPFFNRIICGFLMMSSMSSLYILDINPLSDTIWYIFLHLYFANIPFENIFYHSVSTIHLLWLIASFSVQKFYFDVVPFFIFYFGFPCLGRQIQKNITEVK